MPDRHSPILVIATLLSLILNIGGIVVFPILIDESYSSLTHVALTPDAEEAELEDEDEEVIEDEMKFRPGIEDGSPATATWIGAAEYQELLARQDEVEQGAYTMADGSPGTDLPPVVVVQPEQPAEVASAQPDVPLQMEEVDDPVETAIGSTQSQPKQEESTELGEADSIDEITTTELPSPVEISVEPDVEAQNPLPILDAPEAKDDAEAPNDEKKDSEEPDVETPVDEVEDLTPRDELPDELSEQSEPEEEPDEKTPVQPNDNEQIEDAEDETESSENAPPTPPVRVVTTQGSNGESEPTPEIKSPNATPSDKETTASITKKIPEIKWNNAEPMAMEGLEIKPYSLARHINKDSQDTYFQIAANWNWIGKIKRNPTAVFQFDRNGNVAHLKIYPSSGTGYQVFDKKYLRTWLARWTASGPKLRTLKEGEVTNPIPFTLLFIKEPKKNVKKEDGKGTDDSKP